MGEHVPLTLVCIEYEEATVDVRLIYFEDHGEETNERYERALAVFYPQAKVRKIERGVAPTHDGSC